MLKAAALAIILCLACSLAHAAGCVNEDAETTLTETIARETFPGPPNHDSVANGDEAETYWILTSSEPVSICRASEEKPDFGAAQNQRRLQLVLNEKQYKLYAPLLNQNVSVRGTIFSGHTGHHHTEALVMVKDMRPAAASALTRAEGHSL